MSDNSALPGKPETPERGLLSEMIRSFREITRAQAIAEFSVHYVLEYKPQSAWSPKEVAIGWALPVIEERLGCCDPGFSFSTENDARDHAIRVWRDKLNFRLREYLFILHGMPRTRIWLAWLWFKDWRLLTNKGRRRFLDLWDKLQARITHIEAALAAAPDAIQLICLPPVMRTWAILPIGTYIHVLSEGRGGVLRMGHGKITGLRIGLLDNSGMPLLRPFLPLHYKFDYTLPSGDREVGSQTLLEPGEIDIGNGRLLNPSFGSVVGQQYFLHLDDVKVAIEERVRQYTLDARRGLDAAMKVAAEAAQGRVETSND